MIKQVLITSIAAAGMLLSAQATAHNSTGNGSTVWNNYTHGHNSHGRHVNPTPVRRPAPPKFNVNREQRQQATMIKQGIKNCRITPREANKLNNQQNRIKNAERRMRKGGLQHWERMKLKKRLHKARVQINRLTKNGEKCRRGGHKRRHQHNHGGNHNHSHSNGHNFHSHSNWGFTNSHGSFSLSIGH